MRKDVKSFEFIESEFSNFTIEYLGEIVTELKNILACLSRDTLTVLVSIDITVEEILREKTGPNSNNFRAESSRQFLRQSKTVARPKISCRVVDNC